MTKHSHEINGKLHEDCAMCDEIRRRIPLAKQERDAAAAMRRAETAKLKAIDELGLRRK